jgi:hypothetical protein
MFPGKVGMRGWCEFIDNSAAATMGVFEGPQGKISMTLLLLLH